MWGQSDGCCDTPQKMGPHEPDFREIMRNSDTFEAVRQTGPGARTARGKL
jgi:hypothetical protein